MIKFDSTGRGFGVGEFIDRYGEECSIQDSSLASEAAIWLGLSKTVPKVCVKGKGWIDVSLPEGTFISSRMHLTIPMAKELRIALDRFIERGEVAARVEDERVIHIPTRKCENCDVQFEFEGDERFCDEQCRLEAEEVW